MIGIDLNTAAKKASKVLKRSMKSVPLIYNVTFHGPLDAFEQSGGDTLEEMHGLGREPSCNLR